MLKSAIVILFLTLPTLVCAEGAITGWVHVAGHVYPVHPVAIDVIDPLTGEKVPGLSTVNREDGTYDITGIPDGDYRVLYDAYGRDWNYIDELAGNVICDNGGCNRAEKGAVIHIEGDTRRLNINLDAGAMVEGRITDTSRRPLEGVTVEFYHKDGTPYCCERLTDENGRWDRPVFFPDSYYVVARYAGPSSYEPQAYRDHPCSGCDVTETGSLMAVNYNNGREGINFELERVEANPHIARRTIDAQKFSGSWFNPDRDGEGFIVQVLERAAPSGEGQAIVVFWFTYSPDGKQAWMVGSGAINEGVAEVAFEITEGPFFGADFDSQQLERQTWGSMRLDFLNCSQAYAQFGGAFGSGQLDLSRLSAIDTLGCADSEGTVATGEAAYSGAWFNPSRDGEGFVVEIVDESQVLAYWFTYDLDGRQMWLLGVGQLNGSLQATIPMQKTSGGRFGDALDPQSVVLEEWGEVTIRFDGCKDASFAWVAPYPYDAGSYELIRLTTLKNTSC
jgi:hypothetical protein